VKSLKDEIRKIRALLGQLKKESSLRHENERLKSRIQELEEDLAKTKEPPPVSSHVTKLRERVGVLEVENQSLSLKLEKILAELR